MGLSLSVMPAAASAATWSPPVAVSRPARPAAAKGAEGTMIRPAGRDDIAALAAIHLEALPDDFLAGLGRPFLTRVFYPALLESARCRVDLAMDAEGPAGLIVTRMGVDGVLGELLRARPAWFVASAAWAMARRPGLLAASISILSQLVQRRREPGTDTLAELFLLAVARRARRRGVARSLIEHSAARLHQAGATTYRVLLHADNEPAQAVYEKTGFIESRIHRFAGRIWSERERRLAAPPRRGDDRS